MPRKKIRYRERNIYKEIKDSKIKDERSHTGRAHSVPNGEITK